MLLYCCSNIFIDCLYNSYMAKKPLKCAKCGEEVDSYSYGDYCSTCANEVWDSGFQSTSEHAYEVGFHDLVNKLDKECDKKARHAIGEIMGEWDIPDWRCPSCDAIRLGPDDIKEMSHEEKMDKICAPCPECGEKKCGVPTAPDKYFW